MLHYERVGITVKSGLVDKDNTVDHVVSLLKNAGATPLFDPKRKEGVACASALEEYTSESDIDLMLVIGGDGTILRAARELTSFSVPIVTINKGTIGFMAEMSIDEADELLPSFLTGGGIVETRSILDVKLHRDGKEHFCAFALNEAVVAQGNIARLVDLQTTVNNEPLTVYHADGLIISTPTGSTAYSLAAGGPIVHPGLSATILTPINSYSFSQKPIVIRGDTLITTEVLTKDSQYGEPAVVVLTIDGQISLPLQKGDIISTTMSEKTLKFLRRDKDTYFGTLRQKLKWGSRVDS